MSRKKTPMTAAELQAQLANDQQHQAKMRAYEKRKAAIAAESARDTEGLLRELREAGVRVTIEPKPWETDGYEGPPRSIADLANTNIRYPAAIPILIKHLQMEHLPNIKEGIVRALTVVESQGIAFEALMEEFCRINDPNSELKWNLGRAITYAATPDTVPNVLELIHDCRHGHGRADLPQALLCLPMDEAESLLKPLRDDPDLAEVATAALKRIHRRQRRSS